MWLFKRFCPLLIMTFICWDKGYAVHIQGGYKRGDGQGNHLVNLSVVFSNSRTDSPMHVHMGTVDANAGSSDTDNMLLSSPPVTGAPDPTNTPLDSIFWFQLLNGGAPAITVSLDITGEGEIQQAHVVEPLVNSLSPDLGGENSAIPLELALLMIEAGENIVSQHVYIPYIWPGQAVTVQAVLPNTQGGVVLTVLPPGETTTHHLVIQTGDSWTWHSLTDFTGHTSLEVQSVTEEDLKYQAKLKEIHKDRSIVRTLRQNSMESKLSAEQTNPVDEPFTVCGVDIDMDTAAQVSLLVSGIRVWFLNMVALAVTVILSQQAPSRCL